jgi:hypothetical protein
MEAQMTLKEAMSELRDYLECAGWANEVQAWDVICAALEELIMQSADRRVDDKHQPSFSPTAAVPIASVVRRPPLADSAQQPLPDTVRRCSTCIRDCKGHSSCTQDDYYNWQSA